MLTVLIDDLRSFRDKRDCVVARTPHAAVQWLTDSQAVNPPRLIDELWLDHDMGYGYVEDVPTEFNIWPVIEYMEQNPVNVSKVLIHTGNPVGGKRMLVALQKAGYDASIWFGRESDLWQFIPLHAEEFDKGV